ncbi:unnamed protein product [Moneuplotes crassus]|uniref:Uncharacterized protein n=1 Tax=Euplotes crassus TaxID=5936 RepID=A0AAD1Y5V3_EUPCR|nr:unnamed protein product [Moneuplotes crassus]
MSFIVSSFQGCFIIFCISVLKSDGFFHSKEISCEAFLILIALCSKPLISFCRLDSDDLGLQDVFKCLGVSGSLR